MPTADGVSRPSTALKIPRDIHDAMVAHCLREAPLECCGILGGVAPRVSSFHPLRNAAASETRYDADPRDLIEAVVALRERGAEILAIYHSHPRWEAVPSQTDLRGEPLRDRSPGSSSRSWARRPSVRIWRLDPKSCWQIGPADRRAGERTSGACDCKPWSRALN